MTKKDQTLSSVEYVGNGIVTYPIVLVLISSLSILHSVCCGVIHHSFPVNVSEAPPLYAGPPASEGRSAPSDSSLKMAGAAPVIIGANGSSAKHTATLIFLHGLGDTGYGWASAVGAIKASFVKVICPTAHTIPVTLNSGFNMPAWFDLKTLDAHGPEDTEGIKQASELIHSMIEAEIKEGIPSNRIVIGGFSQGGALAMYSALTYTKPLGGVVALSCWLPLNKTFPGAVKGNKETPFLQCHGDCDPIVPYKWGQMTASILKQYLKNIEFKTYTGLSHSSSDEEMKDVQLFLQKALPNQ